MRLQALQGHPLDWELDGVLVVDAVVLLVVNVPGQPEISHLHRVTLIEPAEREGGGGGGELEREGGPLQPNLSQSPVGPQPKTNCHQLKVQSP